MSEYLCLNLFSFVECCNCTYFDRSSDMIGTLSRVLLIAATNATGVNLIMFVSIVC